MSISKKMRFEVFKRDGFTCCYCGQKPPQVVLEADHIDPKSKGGEDDINNLITACFECNRGKGNREIASLPNSLSVTIDAMQEKQEQLKKYRTFIKKQQQRIDSETREIEQLFSKYFKDSRFTDKFKISIKNFIERLGVDVCISNMENAILKGLDPNDTSKYFCGICWRQIKGGND